jgi:hypothetical protein
MKVISLSLCRSAVVSLLAINNKPAVSQHLPEPAAPATLTSTATTSVAPSTIDKGKNDHKVKRDIFDESDEDVADPSSYFQFDNTDDQIDHKLHALTKETPATVHDATDSKSVLCWPIEYRTCPAF